jgi:type II secretory pathway component PulF
MNDDEFAFFNHQLAAMLRDGIPLEGALRRLCADMREGTLKTEFQSLEANLAKGTPLREAARSSRLPELYQHLLEVGTQSNDLPGVLTLLADHYQRRHDLWTRLKGLMVYPMIVLCSAFLLSCFLAYLLGALVWPNLEAITQHVSTSAARIFLWLSPAVLGLLVLAVLVVFALPMARRTMRWRMPAFKESSLAQVASAMGLMLRSGVPLDQSLALVERLEQGTHAGTELATWRKRLAAGHGKISDLAEPGRAFPPLFIWLVARGGDDLATGFQKAAVIYQARAKHRAEMLLYSALPVSILALGLMLISQLQPVFQTLVKFMNMIGDAGG